MHTVVASVSPQSPTSCGTPSTSIEVLAIGVLKVKIIRTGDASKESNVIPSELTDTMAGVTGVGGGVGGVLVAVEVATIVDVSSTMLGVTPPPPPNPADPPPDRKSTR